MRFLQCPLLLSPWWFPSFLCDFFPSDPPTPFPLGFGSFLHHQQWIWVSVLLRLIEWQSCFPLWRRLPPTGYFYRNLAGNLQVSTGRLVGTVRARCWRRADELSRRRRKSTFTDLQRERGSSLLRCKYYDTLKTKLWLRLFPNCRGELFTEKSSECVKILCPQSQDVI